MKRRKNNINVSEKALAEYFLPFFSEKLQILIKHYHDNYESQGVTLEDYLLTLCEEIGEEYKPKKKK